MRTWVIWAACVAMVGCGSAERAGFVDGTPAPEATGGAATGGATATTTRALVASTGGTAAGGAPSGAGGAPAGGMAASTGGAGGAPEADAGAAPGTCYDDSQCPQGWRCAEREPRIATGDLSDTTLGEPKMTYCLAPCQRGDACGDTGDVCVGVKGVYIVSDCLADKLGGGIVSYFCAAAGVTSGCQ